ncbi:MFS transporter [Enterococcus columbae]|uniref:Major facilitator superfamily (MFS) profile domain-containing protein n=1 Tax=Enterococcus columbae DSM 7374 = ATCC 51263 TaxID=1121865 RepID=S1N6Q4_9ENTE|nr:MFS transporter [Enterococcus columbae]EOT44544.1 hypothetical protein OMW_00600 [Enterococcus columbae DSM 7374 = ATCC 51263]EOW84702.1 hypothetical protein I568_01198 [Enterococcus columbae DSM 7374 = ATCC 51263]
MFIKFKDKTWRFYLYRFFMNGRFSRGVLLLYCMQLGLNLLEFGTIQTVYNLVKLISEIPSGIIADRFRKSTVVSVGAFLCSISSFLLFLLPLMSMDNYISLLLLFSLDSLGSALISGTDESLIFETLKIEKKEKKFIEVLGNAEIIGLIVLAIATASGGIIFSNYFSAVFLLQCIFYILAGLMIIKIDNRNIEGKKANKIQFNIREQFHEIIDFLSCSKVVIYLVLFLTFLMLYANFMITFIQGAFLEIGFKEEIISVLIAGVTLAGVLGAYISRFLGNAHFRIFFTLSVACFLMGIFFLSSSEKILSVVGFFMINILVDLVYPYISEKLNILLEDSMRATVFSIFNTLVGFFSLALYPLLGYLFDKTSYSIIYLGTGIISFIILSVLAMYLSNKNVNGV